MPQNVHQAAYDIVHAAVYPMTLPFDRPLVTVRAHLGQLGVAREKLLETLRPGARLCRAYAAANSVDMNDAVGLAGFRGCARH